MDINIKTKFSIGDTVYFVKESTSYYEIPCTHCGGNYREIVNNIEYKCPYCTGGREKQKIKHYEVESGIVTNIRIALYGEREVVDRITHNHIRTNVLYSVTPHNAVDDYYDTDANSISKYEGELYATRADADEAATMACDCYDARQYREQKAQAERREKNIAKLKSSINAVQDYCTEHNIKVGDEFCTLVTNAGVAIIDGIVGAAAFKFSRLSIKLASGNKSAVVIKVTYSDGTQYEV